MSIIAISLLKPRRGKSLQQTLEGYELALEEKATLSWYQSRVRAERPSTFLARMNGWRKAGVRDKSRVRESRVSYIIHFGTTTLNFVSVERETGLEPATTCLEGRDSAN